MTIGVIIIFVDHCGKLTTAAKTEGLGIFQPHLVRDSQPVDLENLPKRIREEVRKIRQSRRKD